MPATGVSSLVSVSGLSNAALKDAMKTALIESGAVVVDDYLSGSNYFVVTEERENGITFYVRWSVQNTSAIYIPMIFTGWDAVSHVGVTSLSFSHSGGFTAGTAFNAIRAYAGDGYRVLTACNSTQTSLSTNNNPTLLGWYAPRARPASYPTNRPWAVSLNGIFNNFQTPNLAGNGFWYPGQIFTSPPPAPDASLGRLIRAAPAFIGPDWQPQLAPEDFVMISGAALADFPNYAESNYTVTVGGQPHVYRALFINGTQGVAYALRLS